MNRFLLDTNVPSELTRPASDANVKQWLKSADDTGLFLSSISLGEIRKGTASLPHGAKRRQLELWIEETLRPWFSGRILPVNEMIAERWGTLSSELRAKGRPIGMADGLIAATAIEHGLAIVTRNTKDFAGIGLQIVNPWHSVDN